MEELKVKYIVRRLHELYGLRSKSKTKAFNRELRELYELRQKSLTVNN